MFTRDHLRPEEVNAVLDGDDPDGTTAFHIRECDACRRSITEFALMEGLLRGVGAQAVEAPTRHISTKTLMDIYEAVYANEKNKETYPIGHLRHLRKCDACHAAFLTIANRFAPSPNSIKKAVNAFAESRPALSVHLRLKISRAGDIALQSFHGPARSDPKRTTAAEDGDFSSKSVLPAKTFPDLPAFLRSPESRSATLPNAASKKLIYDNTVGETVGPWRMGFLVNGDHLFASISTADDGAPVVGAEIIAEDSSAENVGVFNTDRQGMARIPRARIGWLRITPPGAKCLVSIRND